ncbi:secreted protein [Streptomyces bingchenggensis BCW-1]|uniref:Secreted protein n=1 Tax=Streptomyces bingchenggensis (strain BCW-1) TaxID=749414 RepID=D7BYD8_STRBB|nr:MULTISPECIES: secreted protein [Streptomyces]ADI03466.1 secreted protein [Streptomyces bingchenggensis BCW-1]
MKIAVIGGTGLIGSQVVKKLNTVGHEAVPHSKSTGVDVITGEGVADAVADADVIVSLTNSPTFDEASAVFFRKSMGNLLTAGEKAGVRHFAGPEVFPLDELGRITLAARSDGRTVMTDDTAGMFALVRGDVLTGKEDARLAPTRYADWLASR